MCGRDQKDASQYPLEKSHVEGLSPWRIAVQSHSAPGTEARLPLPGPLMLPPIPFAAHRPCHACAAFRLRSARGATPPFASTTRPIRCGVLRRRTLDSRSPWWERISLRRRPTASKGRPLSKVHTGDGRPVKPDITITGRDNLQWRWTAGALMHKLLLKSENPRRRIRVYTCETQEG